MLLLTSHFILRFKEEPKGFRIERVKWIRLFDNDFQSRPFVGGISSIIFLSSFLDCRGCVEDGYLRGLWAQHLSIFCLALTRHDHGNTSELGFTTKVKGVPDKRQRNSDSDLRKKTWKVLQSNESIYTCSWTTHHRTVSQLDIIISSDGSSTISGNYPGDGRLSSLLCLRLHRLIDNDNQGNNLNTVKQTQFITAHQHRDTLPLLIVSQQGLFSTWVIRFIKYYYIGKIYQLGGDE